MDKRHDDILTTRLETVVHNGMVFIGVNELRAWYGLKRLGSRCWKDLAARWNDVKGEDGGELMKIRKLGGFYFFDSNTVKSVMQEQDEEE